MTMSATTSFPASTAPVTNQYDALPYRGQAHYYTKPDLLACKALLYGLKTPDVKTASMIDLGCGCGENLVPLAVQYPNARFVGVDYSARQVERARESIKGLNLTNLEFHAMSMADVGPQLGTFDYVVCHGVFSWVSPEIQKHIFRIIRDQMTPQGVAYVSYNTLPGWHFLLAIRSLLLRQVRDVREPLQKVAKARAYLNFLAKTLSNEDSVYGKLLNIQAENFKKFHDSYIFHEYLEEDNAPCYFSEFMEQAAQYGLQFVAEAKPDASLANLPPEVRMQFQDLSRSRVDFEQQFDNVHNTTFRRTILAHANVKLTVLPQAEALGNMRFSTITIPEGTGEIDLDPSTMIKFVAKKEISFQTNKPLYKAAIGMLSEIRPRSVSFPELFERICNRIALQPGTEETEKEKKMLLAFLLQCHLSEMLELHLDNDHFTLEPGERPVASRVARWQAAHGDRGSNLRHQLADLTDLDKVMMPLLDGTRTRQDVLAALIELVRQGRMNVARNGKPVSSPEEVEGAVRELLGHNLTRYAKSELLEA